ncbi:hypothetical protein [Bartonella sp. OT172YNZD]|uniref:hypothetical protein n=1 Tax=Bartonella sp. OT172YNZD TaxID=3243572 RepID=UPI0035D102DC
MMENPLHIGELVVEDIIVEFGLSVTETAERFEMVRVQFCIRLASYAKKYDLVQALKLKYPKDISFLYTFLSSLKCFLKAR